MVDSVSLSGKEGKLKGQLARALAKFKKAKLSGNPNEIKVAEIRVKELQKLSKKAEIGKSKKGDSPSMPKKPKTIAEKASPFGKGLFEGLGKIKEDYPVEADDWWEEDEDPDWWKAKPKFGRSPGALGGRHDPWEGFKHGGRIKKAKKRRPRGVKIALRGYGKAMKRG